MILIPIDDIDVFWSLTKDMIQSRLVLEKFDMIGFNLFKRLGREEQGMSDFDYETVPG